MCSSFPLAVSPPPLFSLPLWIGINLKSFFLRSLRFNPSMLFFTQLHQPRTQPQLRVLHNENPARATSPLNQVILPTYTHMVAKRGLVWLSSTAQPGGRKWQCAAVIKHAQERQGRIINKSSVRGHLKIGRLDLKIRAASGGLCNRCPL